ncbi:MAG: chromate transporter [Candidatus Bipolaricaulaceae bacterium]
MLLKLVESFVRVGIGAYGGGIATIRLIYHEIVEIQGWLGGREMAEVVALAQMTPGPIAVNAATYTGFRVAGFSGAALATLAVLLPSLFFLLLLRGLQRFPATNSWVTKLGKLLRPGVIALIVAAVVALGKTTVQTSVSGAFAAASFALALGFREKLHPVLLLLLFGLLGLVLP